MDPLVPGDVVELEKPVAIHTSMAVPAFHGHADPWVVPPTDLSVVSADGGARILTLAICPPKGRASGRSCGSSSPAPRCRSLEPEVDAGVSSRPMARRAHEDRRPARPG